MDIVNRKIQVFITEEEANILQQALGRYIFHGPYWPPDQYPILDVMEKDREAKSKQVARDMCESIQDELLSRYQESEEIKFHQGR